MHPVGSTCTDNEVLCSEHDRVMKLGIPPNVKNLVNWRPYSSSRKVSSMEDK
jgi:hypothetical protein